MSIKIASMKFGDCDTIMHNTPNGMKNIAEVLGPNGEVYWSAIKELTSIPPLSIRSNGTMLLDYLISGNMVHDGTPTPTTPVIPVGTGEKTGNLYPLDASKLHVGRIENDGTINYEVGTLTVEPGSITYEANAAWRGFYTDFIQVNENEKLTFSSTNSTTISCSCSCYDENDNFLGKATSQSTASTRTFTLLTGTEKARMSATSSDTTYTILRPMLNTGSTALPYEPYGYKIPISSAGQTTNVYLGGVQSERQIYKYVFKGNETIAQRDGSHIYYYTPHGGSTMMTYSTIVCSHYIYHNGNAMDAPDNSVFSKAGAGRSIWIRSDTHTDATAFKSYLAQQYAAGTPVTIWYVLAEPETAVVNEPLRKIGDYADTVSMEQAGVQIPTNKGNTVIDVETTLKPSQMYIKYK